MKDKTTKGIVSAIAWVIGVVTSLGIGGLFVGGTFRSVVLLKLLPAIVHTVVGWLIIASTLLGVVMLGINKLSKL